MQIEETETAIGGNSCITDKICLHPISTHGTPIAPLGLYEAGKQLYEAGKSSRLPIPDLVIPGDVGSNLGRPERDLNHYNATETTSKAAVFSRAADLHILEISYNASRAPGELILAPSIHGLILHWAYNVPERYRLLECNC